MKHVLWWVLRKFVALLGASGVALVLFVLLSGEPGTGLDLSPMDVQGLLGALFLIGYLGGMVALPITLVSDVVGSRLGDARLWVALGIHLLGVVFLLLMFGGLSVRWDDTISFLLWVSLGGALTFFALDETVRRKFKLHF